MSKCTFQSHEDFLKDYEAYKSGNHYKLISTEGVEYVRKGLYDLRKSVSTNWNQYIGEVDLVHKFKNVFGKPPA